MHKHNQKSFERLSPHKFFYSKKTEENDEIEKEQPGPGNLGNAILS